MRKEKGKKLDSKGRVRYKGFSEERKGGKWTKRQSGQRQEHGLTGAKIEVCEKRRM